VLCQRLRWAILSAASEFTRSLAVVGVVDRVLEAGLVGIAGLLIAVVVSY
jgi:hypothetical protein